MGAATPFIVAGTSLIQAKNATEIGKFNQKVFDRNAVVLEQEAERIKQKTAYDIAQFDRKFATLQSSVKTRILKSGAELSGTALKILRSNAEEAEIQRNVIDYNSKVEEARKIEEANFAKISGTMARSRSRMQALGYIASASTSLLTNFGNPYGGGNINA